MRLKQVPLIFSFLAICTIALLYGIPPQMRSAARRNEVADFRLEIVIDDSTSSLPDRHTKVPGT